MQIPLTKTAVAILTDGKTEISSRHLFVLRIIAIAGIVLSVILFTTVIILAHHIGAVQYCSPGNRIIPRDLETPGVFDDMTPNEYIATRDYMLNNLKFKLVTIDKATVNSSYIFMIDLHIPLKSAILEYLDRGSNRLERVAKVVIVRGDMKPPRVEEYLVSPLPRPRSHILARNPSFARFPIPYSSRPNDQVDYRHLYPIIHKFTRQVYHILKESYGLCYHNCTKGYDCMLFYDVGPRGKESGDRKSWFWSFRDVEGFYAHPLGLEIQINHESTDVNEWKIDKIVYNGHLFYLVSEFIDRYNKNRVPKISLKRHVKHIDELRSSYFRRGVSEMLHPMQGPKLVEPEGRRYFINGQHVQYMNWNVNIRMRSSTGIQLFDVRFQSERLAYEISLQDVVVFNSGYGPTQSMSNFYHTSWLMGASSFELVPGVDCPDTAAFLDNYHFVDTNKPKLYKNAICIFEHNPGIPLRRHYANDGKGGYHYYGGIIDYHLVVRNIVNIWNYDYIFDYIFHLNGDIEIQVSVTGYVQTTYKLPFEKPYGNTVLDGVMADLHQHLFHFKVDLDIAGLKNSYSILNIDTETVRHPWYHRQNKTQMTISEKLMKREMDITIENPNTPKYHIIHSDTAKNRYGTKQAYRIINNAVSDFLISDVPVTNAASWAKYPIVVTKYDDTEDQSSSIYAQNDPWDPVIDFERFVSDNDSIHNEDLVVWLTLGAHHIPHTEDIPSTPTSFNKYSFHLVPYNFFTECPSVSSPNTIHIQPNEDYSRINVETFGMSYDSTCAQPTVGPYSYYGFRGEN